MIGAAGPSRAPGSRNSLGRPRLRRILGFTSGGPVTPPNPIPGGAFDVGPPLGVLHVFAPGDPSITLPFTGLTLGGFDVEPYTITDFRGSSALAFHVGTARGSDGKTYNLETDIRAFEGDSSSTALHTGARSPSSELTSSTPVRGRSCTTSTAASSRPGSSGRSTSARVPSTSG